MTDLDWQANARCTDLDPHVFFGHGEKMTDPEIAAAKSICVGCPVRESCLTYAVENNIDYGVWGAETPSERRKRRRSWLRDRRGVANRAAQERASAARELANQGYRPEYIAGTLGVHVRTAQRLTSPRRLSVSA